MLVFVLGQQNMARRPRKTGDLRRAARCFDAQQFRPFRDVKRLFAAKRFENPQRRGAPERRRNIVVARHHDDRDSGVGKAFHLLRELAFVRRRRRAVFIGVSGEQHGVNAARQRRIHHERQAVGEILQARVQAGFRV